jgi:hypothetical protein
VFTRTRSLLSGPRGRPRKYPIGERPPKKEKMIVEDDDEDEIR